MVNSVHRQLFREESTQMSKCRQIKFAIVDFKETDGDEKFIFSVPIETNIVVSTRCQANVLQISD